MSGHLDTRWRCIRRFTAAGTKLAAIVLFAAGGTAASHAAGPEQVKKDTRPGFYLTKERVDGSQALNACAPGYHMASLWEIMDPSNRRYATELGLTVPDSGSGPPSIQFGWVRTSRSATTLQIPGVGNCSAWTTNSAEASGTAILLRGVWDGGGTLGFGPWSAAAGACSSPLFVWCAED